MDDTKLVEVCALWEQTSKQGNVYHTGTLKIGDVYLRVRLFKNTKHQEGDDRPALRLVAEVPKTETERKGKEPQT